MTERFGEPVFLKNNGFILEGIRGDLVVMKRIIIQFLKSHPGITKTNGNREVLSYGFDDSNLFFGPAQENFFFGFRDFRFINEIDMEIVEDFSFFKKTD